MVPIKKKMIEPNNIYLGDCLDLMREIPDKSIDLVLTDPPYGIDYQSAWRIDKSQWKPKILNDKEPFVAWTDEAFRILKDDSALLCFTRFDTEYDFRKALTESGFNCKQQIIWDKVIHGMGDLCGDFASQHENIIFATKGNFIFKGKRPTSIFRVVRVNAEKLIHPNEKPIALLTQLIESVTIDNNLALDCFLGSGTTAIACIKTGRRYIGIEKDKNYFEIAQTRIDNELKQLKLAL